MQRLAPSLVLLHADAPFRERVHRAAPLSTVLDARDWEELRGALRYAPPGTVAVVDPYTGGEGLSGELRDLLRDFRSATVIAAYRFGAAHYGDLRTLGQWGVAELICIGREDTRAALARRLRAMQARAVQRVLQHSLAHPMGARGRAVLTAAAETVATGGQAPELAAALELTERTLLRWCARTDLPPPRRLLAWLRVLLACDLLDDPGHTLSSASRACGYAADMPLRRAIRNLVGLEPRELRERGALATAAARFAAELGALREAGRERRRAKQHAYAA
ncbi:MAG TPA: helix-turn-helix domain-containing protein [Longimicrobiaceae bacterium]|jgi:AraC-like DNA-binding protein|nr:helix-turn-helix domain-containing protein [Longimicrobiaceae bacterium]